MEIWTMLKANLRHKKGAFVSVAVLMLIICMSFAAFLSVKQNCAASVERALTSADIPDLTVYYPNGGPSEDLLGRLEEHLSVQSVAVVETVVGSHPRCGEKTDDNDVLLCALTDNYRIQNESLSGYAAQTPPLTLPVPVAVSLPPFTMIFPLSAKTPSPSFRD